MKCIEKIKVWITEKNKRRAGETGKTQEASFTVEAAILFPIVFFLICGLIDVSLFLRDRVIIEAAVMQTASRAVMQQKNEIDFSGQVIKFTSMENETIFDQYIGRAHVTEVEAKEYLIEELDRIAVAKVQNIEVKVTPLNVKVKVDITLHSEFFFIFENITEDIFSSTVEVNQIIYEPEETTRIATVILSTLEGVPGMEELLDKIKRVVSLAQ